MKIYQLLVILILFGIIFDTSDQAIINSIYNNINNDYQKKINTIQLILKSEIPFNFQNYKDIISFFKKISPLNIEYNFGSRLWNFLIKDNQLYVQNSIPKNITNLLFYNNLINPIKNTLKNSNVQYKYFEFKNRRFLKTKDIIFVFDLKN